jgi:hypothetical protein
MSEEKKVSPTRKIEEAIGQGFVVIRNYYAISNRYWQYCTVHKLPFVRIRLKSVYAVVTLDLDTITDPEKRTSKEFAVKLRELFEEEDKYKSRYRFLPTEGGSYEYAHKIPIERAVYVATRIWEMANEENALVSRSEAVDWKQHA